MKKNFSILIIAALLLSCGKGSGSKPGDVVKLFTENITKGKLDEAKKYGTESTSIMIDFAAEFNDVPSDPNYKFKMIRDSIVDDKAWVTFVNEKGQEETIDVVFKEGKWLVHIESNK